MSERIRVKISEICQVKSGKRLPKGNLVQDEPTAYRYIRVKDMHDGGIDTKQVKFITEEVYETLKLYKIYVEDIYLSNVGTIGEVGEIPLELNGSILTENAVRLTNFTSGVNKLYIQYFLQSPLGQIEIQKNVVGSTQPKLPIYGVKNIELELPSKKVQDNVVEIISKLFELIRSLQNTNEKLEAYAQTLYRYYFVDFVPFQDGAFVESELGAIPNLFTCVENRDLFMFSYGKTLKATERIEGEFSVVGSGGVIGTHNKYLLEGPNIIVGRKGTCGRVTFVHENCFPIDTTFYISQNKVSLYYIYFSLLRQNLEEKNSDSAVPGLNREVALSQNIIEPDKETLDTFNKIVEPIFQLIHDNQKQIKKLQEQRDFLLPRLLSGELSLQP